MTQEIQLTFDMMLVLGILGLTAILFIFSVIRVDVVAVLVLGLIGICKLLPADLLFTGFSSDAVISLISITIISAGLENVGISVLFARWMLKLGKSHPKKISILLMTITGFLAAFMRSLGTVALLLPVISKINARTGISKSYLLMPIGFCAILGGTLTMVGSGPLILLNSALKSSYKYLGNGNNLIFEPFELFDVLPIGLMLLASGIIYWFFVGNKLTENIIIKGTGNKGAKAHFKSTYNKFTDIFEIKVNTNSLIVGKTIKDLETAIGAKGAILALEKDNETHFPPLRNTIIEPSASVAIMWDKDLLTEFSKEQKITIKSKLTKFAELLHPIKSGLCETVIPPSSNLTGKEVNELHMKRQHDINVLAMRRGNDIFQGEELRKRTLRPGDTLGMYSSWENLSEFQKNPDFVVLTTSYPKEKYNPKKMPIALTFFALSIVLIVARVFPITVGLLLGAIGMIATGVITIDKAYESVSWRTVFLLAGLLPLGLAMQTTGTADWFSHLVIDLGLDLPIPVMLLLLAVITTFLALLISNIGAAIILIPIALELAVISGGNPKIYALTVALAASNTFLIPTHQVNALIAGPGGYSVKDFLVFGSIITIIFLSVMLLGVNLFF